MFMKTVGSSDRQRCGVLFVTSVDAGAEAGLHGPKPRDLHLSERLRRYRRCSASAQPARPVGALSRLPTSAGVPAAPTTPKTLGPRFKEI
jgi:hypothetical protein